MDWAWVSVPKYSRVMLAVGLYSKAISRADPAAPATDRTNRTLTPRAKRREKCITDSTTSGHTK